MQQLNILITAGPTREALDPVRFISNRSSGKMGYALAEAARKKGHRVILISGPVSLNKPKGIKFFPVETAAQMYKRTLLLSKKADLIVMCAAVADYTLFKTERTKIKKHASTLTLRLRRTKDILAELGRRKTEKQILVGFAAETSNLLENAQTKLASKNLDYIVANQVGSKTSGFESDYNQAVLLDRWKGRQKFSRMKKEKLAERLVSIWIGKRS